MGASGAFFLPLLGLWLCTQDDRNKPIYQARHNDLLVETAIVHTNHYQQNICLDHCPAHPGLHEGGKGKSVQETFAALKGNSRDKDNYVADSSERKTRPRSP